MAQASASGLLFASGFAFSSSFTMASNCSIAKGQMFPSSFCFSKALQSTQLVSLSAAGLWRRQAALQSFMDFFAAGLSAFAAISGAVEII